MGIYGGIQLPNINEENLDDKKERKQILNYLALLDEKLRYMFQNIDIEENLSEDAQKMFFQYGKDITNLIKDTEGNFSAFKQSIDGITIQVQDLEGNHALLQQTADGLISAVGSVEGSVSLLQQEAARIETEVQNLDGEVSTLTQTADGLSSTVKKLQDDVTKNASAITQTATEIRSEVSQRVTSLNNSIDSLDDDIYDLTGEVDSVRSVAEQAADRFSWIVESGTSASSMTLTDEFLEIVADEINIEADINLYGEMTVYKTASLSSEGGSIGYMYGYDVFNGSTRGIGIRSGSGDCDVVAHGSGVSLIAEDYGAFLYYYDGNFMPTEDGDQMMGDPDFRWQGVYAKNGTIQTSDRRKKKDIEYDMAKYEEFFGKLKPTQYKMIDGESDRYHIGFISQDVEDTLAECGLESTDFAGFIKTPKRAVRDDANSEILDYHYSLRYDEFVALNTHMIQKLMARVSELESKLEALS